MAIFFSIERSGNTFNARADNGAKFFVGLQTRFDPDHTGSPTIGLFNVPSNPLPKLLYTADDHRDEQGFWADFIEPTAVCEGQNFLAVNTYDRAKFTWGFGQFAAHVPDGDFVLFFRDMLARPEAVDYFPDLEVQAGRIVKIRGNGAVALETSTSTQPLMDYLNPTLAAVEDDEVFASAKLVHWATNHAEARMMQVAHMTDVFKRLMARADRRLGLDGRPAALCSMVCDILHQGRASFAVMQQALLRPDPFASLRAIGRGPKLAKAIDARPEFVGKTWRRDAGAFVSA